MESSNINGCKFYAISPTNGTMVDTNPLEYYARRHGETDLEYYIRRCGEIDRLTFLGSCNGLVAILFDTKLILWNPLTNEQSFIRVRVNVLLECRSDPDHGYSYLFALCYDSSKDEYVVVVGFDSFEYESDPVTQTYGGSGYIEVYFYNLKYGSERRGFVRTEFRLLDGNLLHGDIGKVICGLPHWVIRYNYYLNPIVKTDIVYFDLNEEMFKKMAQPNASVDKTMLGLATLDEENQLGCVLHDIGYGNLEVWVMKEYGNSESWSNMFMFPYTNILVGNCRSISCMNVMGFMPSGELLVSLNDRELWVYDIDNGNPMEMKLRDLEFLIVCEPRFISPPRPIVEDEDEDEDLYYVMSSIIVVFYLAFIPYPDSILRA